MRQKTNVRRALGALLLAALVVGVVPPASQADEGGQRMQSLTVSTHSRLTYDKDVERVAVADPEILEAETITAQEVLLLGKKPGRTTVMVWFSDGSMDFHLYQVRRDFSILEDALREIYETITVQSAPDRDAVILRGLVPDLSYKFAAEEAAQRYLDARKGSTGLGPTVGGVAAGSDTNVSVSLTGTDAEALRISSAVINLIRVESLPGRLEDRIALAFEDMGVTTVRVKRMVRGRLPDDEADLFVLEGWLQTQIDLIRILSVAQGLLGVDQQDDIRVRADESGALTNAEGGSQGLNTQMGSRSLSSVFGSSQIGSQLRNLIDANIGRAKVVEAANGRLLSFIEVRHLPQVRVDVRLYEVNTTKLREYRSNWALLLSNFTQPSLNPAGIAGIVQGEEAARVGAMGENPDVQNVLGFLAGELSNQFQLSGDNVAVDAVLSLLESQGWARSLSRPSLTVLSGERAFFQVGGEIPVTESVATAAIGSSVLNSVFFKPFGVQLGIRPLVGEDGRITMDVVPEVSIPDAQLTAAIRESTGTRQETTAFRTRYLRTTALLDDGESMMIGGILSRNMSHNDDSTPGISDVPLIGGVFDNYSRQGDEVQLVIVLHPVIEREPTNKARLWAYPEVHELMRGVHAPVGTSTMGVCR